MTIQFDDQPPFPWAEHESRLRATRQAMAEQNIDVLAISSLRSAYYLFGTDLVGSAGMLHLVLLPIRGQPVTVSWEGSVTLLRQSVFEHQLMTYARPGEDAPVLLEAIRKFSGMRRLGLERFGSSMPGDSQIRLRAALHSMKVEVVDPCDIVARQSVVKSAMEISYIRHAAAILDTAFHASFDAMRPGARECDVAAAAQFAAYSAGGEYCIHPPMLMSGVNTFKCTRAAPTRRKMKEGEIITFEWGASYFRYYAVAAHSVIFAAEPTPQQVDTYAICRERIDAAVAAMAPGVPASEIAKTMMRFGTDQSSFREAVCLGYSAGIGYDGVWYDPFFIEPSNPTPLAPGMIVSIFGSQECGEEGWMLSVDPVLVTPYGAELLTQIERSKLRTVGYG